MLGKQRLRDGTCPCFASYMKASHVPACMSLAVAGIEQLLPSQMRGLAAGRLKLCFLCAAPPFAEASSRGTSLGHVGGGVKRCNMCDWQRRRFVR